jgi:LysR family transcriptional regulator, low CO2-responsive transcriptional regulator
LSLIERGDAVGVAAGHADLAEVPDGVHACSDVGVLVHAEQDPRLHLLPLRKQRIVIMVPSSHALAQRRRVKLKDLEGQPFIMREQGSTTREVLERALAAVGVRVRVVVEIGSRESIREAVAAGIGLGAVSEIAFIPDARIVALPIENAEVFTYSHMICLSERRDARVIAAFLAEARAMAERWSLPRRSGRSGP